MAGKCSGMDIWEVCESQGTTVHGMVVGELSPVKDSRGKAGVRYFEGQLSDGKKTVQWFLLSSNCEAIWTGLGRAAKEWS